MDMKRIICTGVGGSAGNNFIKSLRMAEEKIYIVGLDCSKYYAKLSQADKTYISPKYDDPDYIPFLNGLIAAESIEFLHAQPDTEVKVISDNREKINAKTFLPSKKAIDIAQDKFVFNRLMGQFKVPVPETIEIDDDPKYVYASTGKWWLRARRGAGSLAALPVSSHAQIMMWIDYWKTRGLDIEDFILCDFLPGKEYAFQSIWKDGELITSAARQRIEYLFQNRMPSGQSSTPTIAKSVHNTRVNQVALSGILTLDQKATGVFCVDLKENEKGVPCITEINAGRFFTTCNFFAEAGSNMPYYYVKLAYEEDLPDLPKYNAVPKDLFFIRQMDCGSAIVKEDELA